MLGSAEGFCFTAGVCRCVCKIPGMSKTFCALEACAPYPRVSALEQHLTVLMKPWHLGSASALRQQAVQATPLEAALTVGSDQLSLPHPEVNLSCCPCCCALSCCTHLAVVEPGGLPPAPQDHQPQESDTCSDHGNHCCRGHSFRARGHPPTHSNAQGAVC